jgi:prevent-host-death family protein
MSRIELAQAQEHLLELVEQAIEGEEVVITKDNQPLVKLVPALERRRQRQFGSAKGLIEMSEDFDEPLEDFKDYM